MKHAAIFIVLFITLVTGCGTGPLTIEASDVINPVLMNVTSEEESKNLKKIGFMSAMARTEHSLMFMYAISAAGHRYEKNRENNLNAAILNATHGSHQRAIEGLEIELELKHERTFFIFYNRFRSRLKSYIHGEVIEVVEGGQVNDH